MAKFIPCTGPDGKPVWVNFDLVRKMEYFPEYDPPFTRLHFTETDSPSVHEKPDWIAERANKN